MRKTLLTALSAFALIAGSAAITVPADAATKPAYKVTLNTSVAKSEAGRFITVAGKVTGPKAAGKTVIIQRGYSGGSWVTVATAVVKPSGRYAARVETPRGGTTGFRAIKAKSSVRKAGVSPTRAIPVYEWLYVSHQNAFLDESVDPGVTVSSGGKTYPSSIRYNGSTGGAYKFGRVCTKFTGTLLYDKNTPPAGTESADFYVSSYTGDGGPGVTVSKTVAEGVPASLVVNLTGVKYVEMGSSQTESGYVLSLGTPRVYCNASRLPDWVSSDFS